MWGLQKQGWKCCSLADMMCPGPALKGTKLPGERVGAPKVCLWLASEASNQQAFPESTIPLCPSGIKCPCFQRDI